MGFDRAVGSFARNAQSVGLNLVEGNRGLFDGIDAAGTHSTAELAKALKSPVVLVIDTTKATRTVAALALGCQALDPQLQIAGVILNQVAGARHERVIREAIEKVCRLPVLGAVPRAPEGALLSMRHLGLVTPLEYSGHDHLARELAERVGRYLDFDRLLAIARGAPPIPPPASEPHPPVDSRVTIGYLNDAAFSFYYPENLEALEAAGARLEAISALAAAPLPGGLDALYIGGGFPETHAEALSENAAFLRSIRAAAQEGLPIYAECGGLMLLARALTWQGHKYPMAGVLPFEVQMCAAPQGHGYTELTVDTANPFFPVGACLRGHEFHYSKIVPDGSLPPTAAEVLRGAGSFAGRDAVLVGNVWAAYTHLHALATPEWAPAMVRAARCAQVAV